MRIIVCVLALSLFAVSQAHAQAKPPTADPSASTGPARKATKKHDPEMAKEQVQEANGKMAKEQVQEANGNAPLSQTQKDKIKSTAMAAPKPANIPKAPKRRK